MDKIKLSVAEKLKEYRKLNKMSQLQLAEKLDRSVKTIQQWEQANTGVPVEILLLLRDELKISIDEIFGLQPINKPLTNEDLINDL
jgi:transcriptional regulator with XRE-family HTH domain